MPFVEPTDMLQGAPLPGWTGRFFHSEHMTFAYWDIAADAAPLREHQHVQEEVWHVVEGEVLITIAGVEQQVGPGSAAVVPPNTLHSARAITAARAVVADYPLRESLPGMTTPRASHSGS